MVRQINDILYRGTTTKSRSGGSVTLPNAAFLLGTAFLVGLVPLHAQNRDGGEQIDALARSIKAGNVAAVEIFGVSRSAEFRVNVNPQRLESWWEYKLTFRDLVPRTDELLSALRSSAIRPSSTKLDSLDVRCGVVFYSKTQEGKRIASIYFDKSGRGGALSSLPTLFGPDFLVRLKKALHFSVE